MKVKAYGIKQENTPLEPLEIHRRKCGKDDVLIEIIYSGVCHSDIHTIKQEWGKTALPMVVGHEIAGIVREIGENVRKYKIGDRVGIGCLINSCQSCTQCHKGYEQFCEQGTIWTYDSQDIDGTVTLGGYSTHIVANQNFVLKIPQELPLDQAAPLLCAGITTYSPLRRYEAGPGKKVGIIGLGGLGHLAVKIAVAMGAEVSVISRSLNKKEDAYQLGAAAYYASQDNRVFDEKRNYFDLIINTVSAPIDLNDYLNLLAPYGTLVSLGIPPQPFQLFPSSVIHGNRQYAGSLIGGIAQTQEMLDFCAKHQVTAEIEIIKMQDINEAWKRVETGDVKFRFVIDMASLKN